MVHEAPVTPCAWPARLVEGGRAHGAGRLRAVRGITPSSLRRRARVGTASGRSGVIVSHSRHDTRSVQHTLIFLLLNGATGSTEKIQQNQHKKYNLQCISNVFKYISSCGKAGRKNRAALSPPTGEARFPCVSYIYTRVILYTKVYSHHILNECVGFFI